MILRAMEKHLVVLGIALPYYYVEETLIDNEVTYHIILI